MLRVKLSEEFEEEMILLQMDHLRQTNLVVCQLAVDRLKKVLFDDGLKDKEWHTKGNVANCNLNWERRLRNNVILFMFKEQLGLSPKYYQLLTAIEPYGCSCIQCLLRMLLHEKMVLCLYSMRFFFYKDPLFPNQAKKIQDIINQRTPLRNTKLLQY